MDEVINAFNTLDKDVQLAIVSGVVTLGIIIVIGIFTR